MNVFCYFLFCSFFAGSLHAEQGPILFVFGTRPEGIKLIPLYLELKKRKWPVLLCSTGQHKELLESVYSVFNVNPEFDLSIMQPNQDLLDITIDVLKGLKEIFLKTNPRLVIVQGDTTSAMCGALAAFYQKIPIAHVEAGLRTDDKWAPYPEETNRRIISLIADYHFAPTQEAYARLRLEGIQAKCISLTGNTVVDALQEIVHKIKNNHVPISQWLKTLIEKAKSNQNKIIMLTAHRRESLPFLEQILSAIKQYAQTNQNTHVIYARHPNPIINKAIQKTSLEAIPNIHVCDPLPYPELIYLLSHADLIVTDSGGIQEEAVSIGKTVLILRNSTERPEGIKTGLAHLVGTNPKAIIQALSDEYAVSHKNNSTVFGDGHACSRIADFLARQLN